jgi:hypothetical protein
LCGKYFSAKLDSGLIKSRKKAAAVRELPSWERKDDGRKQKESERDDKKADH